jgi:ABC transport system ATP-binding/permease protein
MNYLSAESISKSYHDKWLFQELFLGISQGEKLALVGENGAGKTTILKILTGQIAPDTGLVSVRDGIRMGYLTQQPNVDGSLSVKEIIFDEKNKIATVVKEYEDCIHDPHVTPERMQAVLELMEEHNAWDYESKVQTITSKLGVTDFDQKFSELSGGQRKRVFMAQMLLTEPDLIIMDEPTNHLDLEAIEWLENYLSGQNITLIMVTHDRYFLDNVAEEIIELDRGRLFRYKGHYSYFLEKKAEREEKLKTEIGKARQLLKKELEWMRKQPRARGTKAKYRIEAYYELEEKASINLKKDLLELDISESRQGGKIMELHHVSKSFYPLTPGGGTVKHLIKDFSYTFKKKDRIGLVGKNGVGKSTFLNLLTGKVKPDTGEIIPGVTTKIGYFTQETVDLNPALRVIEEVKEIAEFITLSDGTQLSASRFLEQFLFSPVKQYTFIDKLSGGEKKRLQLLKILISNPNFLILDEPTNDFDIDTLNVLEDFLEKFSGCLLLVSHDRYFMDQLVDQLFILEGDSQVKLFNGNYTDYRLQRDEAEQMREAGKASVKPIAPPIETKKSNGKEKKEIEKLQQEIAKLELEKATLSEKINSGKISNDELIATASSLQKVSDSLDEKILRLLELEEAVASVPLN